MEVETKIEVKVVKNPYSKQKKYQDKYRAVNQWKINEYYRNQRKVKKELESNEYKQKIIAEYLETQKK